MHDSATGEPPALANEEYTVGWICALYTEYIAAQVFLDEIHAPSTGIAKHDNNDYVLGRIGRHNVAIAVMPGGEYGTASAAVTATDMLHTFTNVRIGLMVGIGGGAPSAKNDIRLGDIVVSVPQNGLGGVFQYDFGKTIQDQPFQATRFLAPPPRPLLSAINGVRAEHEINGHTIQEDIEACLAKKTRLKKKFSRPDSESDRLYSATTIHQAGEESCLGACDIGEASIISRRAREEGEDDPAVHYGLIASANNLMKDAHLRDQYAAEKNVLCFEMEAGGLMNQFPCIVIRGICDYSDTHKNKDWQGYAAMTAAAYAKDLIKRINSDKLQAERKIIDVLESSLSLSRSIKDTVDNIQADAYLARVIKWLSSPDPSTNLNKARELHQHGTGQWLLDSDRYQSWTTTPSSFLWLYGIPGCGKTILSSTVVTNLQQQNTCSQGLLYFYFDFSDVSKRSTENAIRSLICQLYLKEAATREILDSIYETSANTGGKPGIQTLSNTLKVMLDKCVSAWIVLDGLDECETRDQHGADGLMQWIKGIRSCKNVHLLVTSRPEQDIKSSIEKWANEAQMIALQSSLVANDIEAYIDFEVNQMDRWHDRPAIQGLIKMTLKNKADGMFRWVACQFDILDKCLRPADIRAALATLPHTLDDTYKRILQRLPQEYKPTARRLLQFLTYSTKPLTIQEAIDVISIEPGSSCRFDPEDRMPIPEEITRYCSSLISLVTRHDKFDKTKIVELQLSHFSVQEYFRSDRLDSAEAIYFGQKEAAEEIMNLCLSYLLAVKLPSPLKPLPEKHPLTATWKDYSSYTFWDSADQVMQLRMQYPFADFSARHWYKYAYILESSNEEVHETVKEYYNNKGAFTLGYTIYAPDIRDLPEPYTSVAPLYYASCTGLKHSVNLLLTTNADVNMKSGCYGTALIAASIGGHNVIAEMLIQHGADVNAREIGEYTCALVAALDREHEAVAMTLVQNGADANADFFEGQDDDSRNERYWVNALQAASYRGYQGIVEALLKNGAEVNTKGGVYGTALIIAAQNGFLGIVRLLLQYGADINATAFGMGYALDTGYESSRSTCDEFDEEHGLLFKYSPSSGGLRIAATLTQDEADVNSTDGGYGALAAAADAEYIAKRPADYLEIVKLLIQEGACVNKQGGYFGNALQTAAKSKFHEAVETLIQHGADVNAQGGHYGNALQAAAWAGCQEVAETLIQHGADVNAQGGCYGNALQAASEAGHKEVVEALILLGANVNAQGARHGSALLAAVRGLTGEARGQRGAGRMNYQWIVETLVRNGADVNVKGGFYGNALQAATAAGCKQVVEILIEHGADVHAQGGHYGCALHAALLKVAETGWRQPGDAVTTDHVEIATILIQNGAKLIVRGGISEDGAEATPAAADEHNADTSAQQ